MSTEPEPTPSEVGTDGEPDSENQSLRSIPMQVLERQLAADGRVASGQAANVVNCPPPPLPEDHADPVTGSIPGWRPRLDSASVNRPQPFPGWPAHLHHPDTPEFEGTGMCPDCNQMVRREHWHLHIRTNDHLRNVRLQQTMPDNVNQRIR